MRTHASIRARVLVATVVLSIGGLLFAGHSLHGALEECSNARALATTSEALATLSRATFDLSLERSLNQVAVELPDAIEPAQRALIATQQQKSALELQKLSPQAAEVMTTARGDTFLASLATLREQLTPLRQRFDRLTAVARDQRPPEIVESLPRDMKALVVSFQALRHLLRGPGLLLPTEVGILEAIRDQAWQIREFGGRERTYIAIGVATNAPITPARLEEMGALSRRAGDAWLDITSLALHEGLPEALQAAVRSVADGYFGRYDRLRTAMIAEAHKPSPAYPVDFDSFFSQSAEALRGTEELSFAASAAIEAYWVRRAQATWRIVVADALAGSLLVAVGMASAWMTINAFRRLDALRGRMASLAGGEITAEIPHADMRDEVGAMARTVMVFRTTAQQRAALEQEAARERADKDRRQAAAERHTKDFTDGLAKIIAGLSTAAKRMDAASGSMAEAAGRTGDLASVTTARAKRSAADLASVASATVQMTKTVNAISDQVARAAATSRGIATNALNTERTMTGLSDAAAQVGDVAQLIGAIARQTNLLALNATIEAARAGEAGRGFAIVALEVKQLASRTAIATAEIASQIGAIQTATSNAVAAVRQMSAEMRQMEEMAAAVATAVEEQGVGVRNISTSIASVTQATAEAVAAMGEALASAEETRATSGEVRSVAGDLGLESDILGRQVAQFLHAMREEPAALGRPLHVSAEAALAAEQASQVERPAMLGGEAKIG